MRFWPKTYFKWTEPMAFVRMRDADEFARLRWWVKPLFALIFAFVWILITCLARLVPHPHKPPPPLSFVLPAEIIFAFVVVYSSRYISQYSPSKVFLKGDHLMRLRGKSTRKTKYVDLQSFSWQEKVGVTILVLNHRKKNRVDLVGVPPELSQGDIHLFLSSRGVMPK